MLGNDSDSLQQVQAQLNLSLLQSISSVDKATLNFGRPMGRSGIYNGTEVCVVKFVLDLDERIEAFICNID